MASARVDVIQTVNAADVPADRCLNTLHFNGGTDFAALAGAVLDLFSGGGSPSFTLYENRELDVRAYDIADDKPRPIRGESTLTPSPWAPNTLGPRLLACCLSYYAGRNLPRLRGRMYIGPFADSPTGNMLVPSSVMTQILNLGQDLLAGVAGWTWVVRSNVASSESAIDHVWVDNAWDVQHRREGAATARIRYPGS